ncbi:MAG TPA: helix-turn-helix domain-containing protein [Frankiaceae bacterium]|nr:helix-turn-helix domain-containing protein [Frankiaceae bacterium]
MTFDAVHVARLIAGYSTEGVRINTDGLPDILTVEETARLLRVSRGLAFAAVRQGDIPSVRVGRRILIPKTQLLAWLADAGRSSAPSSGAQSVVRGRQGDRA